MDISYRNDSQGSQKTRWPGFAGRVFSNETRLKKPTLKNPEKTFFFKKKTCKNSFSEKNFSPIFNIWVINTILHKFSTNSGGEGGVMDPYPGNRCDAICGL